MELNYQCCAVKRFNSSCLLIDRLRLILEIRAGVGREKSCFVFSLCGISEIDRSRLALEKWHLYHGQTFQHILLAFLHRKATFLIASTLLPLGFWKKLFCDHERILHSHEYRMHGVVSPQQFAFGRHRYLSWNVVDPLALKSVPRPM